MDCGPSCLRMIAAFYGRNIPINNWRENAGITREGVSLLGIADAAEKEGFRSAAIKITIDQLNDIPLPAILHWKNKHFVVLYKIKNDQFFIADPGIGKLKVNKEEVLTNWIGSTDKEMKEGVVLLLETTTEFYSKKSENRSGTWSVLKKYLLQYKKRLIQLGGCLLLGSLFLFIFPYLTQAIVDRGIKQHRLDLIKLILLGQFILFLAQTSTEFIRARLLLFVSTHINLSILSDFWKKLMRLPLSFFETKKTGDIIQRINDHRRIETFITGSALNTIFSVFNLFVFSIVLFTYSVRIFSIFLAGSILYFTWIYSFLSRKRKLDYDRFAASAKESSATMQLIYGMQEIKLNNAENLKRKEWQSIQSALFQFNFRSLSLSQYQQAGAVFINQGKNILISYLVAVAVLGGFLTLGQMLAIQFIIGQLNSPVEQLSQFIQQAQEARISLERLNEIQQLEDEESSSANYQNHIDGNNSIRINSLSFAYPGAGNDNVLHDINLEIPEKKVTALVGVSGSGKTTLLKLLQKFYDSYKGKINIGNTDLKKLRPRYWRGITGSVMQDSYIFNDTIANNIALGDENPDKERIKRASRIAEIDSFINVLPQGFDTRIGSEAAGISGGQRQRMFIARAVYKDPEYLFFDEATNALDANNERAIMENLESFFKGRTVVVAAHRLSTVMNADKIVVIDRGRIIEEGTHEELTRKEGKYYELVKNQLELGL